MSSSELTATWRQQILERHQASQRADDELKKSILNKIEAVRRAAVMIKECRQTLPQPDFELATDFLSDNAIAEYIRFAAHHPEAVDDWESALHSIKIALQTSGALEFPRGFGFQKLHTPSFFQSAANLVMTFVAGFKKFTRLHPVSGWDIDTAETFLFSLRPLEQIRRQVTLHVQKHREQQWSTTR